MPRPGIPDPYRRRAKAQGFASRAVFKLQAIDAKHRLFQAGQRVLDLGCSPGSWLQYLGAQVGPQGMVVGVDLEPPAITVAPPLYFVAGDISSLDLGALRAISPYFDAVVSDMAPKTTGIREVDQERSLALARQALAGAQELLQSGGHFLVKIFAGPETESLVSDMRQIFTQVHRIKPAGSRPASPEIYLLGLRKRTGPGQGKRRRPPGHREP